MMKRVVSVYDSMLDVIDRVVSVVVTVMMAILAVVLIIQVFFRYVLNDSLSWAGDVARLSFISLVLLSIPLVFRFNAHVALDFVIPLGPRGTRMRNRLNAVLMMILCGFAAVFAAELAKNTWDQMMPTMPVSVGMFYVSLFISQVHCCLHVGRLLLTGEPSTKVFNEI
jgi:TRAP-type transport system small permease protein